MSMPTCLVAFILLSVIICQFLVHGGPYFIILVNLCSYLSIVALSHLKVSQVEHKEDERTSLENFTKIIDDKIPHSH